MDKRLGFIHSKFDIKILLLYILRQLPEPTPHETICSLTMSCDDGISYFDFAECLSDLVQSEHVTERANKYSITAKGRENGEIMESDIPYSVRMRADRAVAPLSEVQRRAAMINASHDSRGRSGYKINLDISDGVGPMMSLELYAADEKQAVIIENNFRKNAENVYQMIIDALSEK